MENRDGGKKKIMVAMDESEASIYALEWTLQELEEIIQNSKLYIFTAQPLADLSYTSASLSNGPDPELIAEIHEEYNKAAEGVLEMARESCTHYGVGVEKVTEVGDPKEAICGAVQKYDIDLLVVGSHGRNTTQRALLGSVSNYCVHNAKCPVLVVKEK